MIRTLIYFCACIAILAESARGMAPETWIDDFSKPGAVGERYDPAWQEVSSSSKRYFSPDDSWGRRESLLRRPFGEGEIEVTTGFVKPIALAGVGDFYCAGLVVKSIGDDVVLLRLGAYGQIILDGKIGGEGFKPEPKPFAVDTKTAYRVSVVLRDGRIKVEVNGTAYYDLPCPISTAPGRTGFYSETPVWYDDYKVTGVLPDPFALKGTPAIEAVYTVFRADLPEQKEALSVHGAIELYLRNTGDGPAQLESLEINGEPANWDSQSTPVSFYDQRPWRIEPGQAGLVLLRIRGLPESMGEKILADINARPEFTVTAHWAGGVNRSFQIPLKVSPPPLQINFLAFSNDLTRLYVYVQNNDWIHGDSRTSLPLEKVFLDGKDVTAQATFGERTLGSDIVPIVVDLEKPLIQGRHVTVMVESANGQWAGHCLRAIPSRTILQVCVGSEWTGERVAILSPRADWIEDIRNHCANTVGVVGETFDYLVRVKEAGLWTGGLGSFADWGRPWANPAYPEIAMCWMDEVDKESLATNVKRYRAMESWARERGKRVPLHVMNIMIPNNASGTDFMEVVDGVMHAYAGREMIEEGFGRFESMPWREYRRGRRPFIPYFRDAEIVVPVDVEGKKTLEHLKTFRRCVSPQEERWMYYGNLLQGAKGVAHWLYIAQRDKGFYEITGPVLRLGLGATGTGKAWQYQIRRETVDMLQATWDEIGRCNAEWRAIEDLIAVSDVTDRAKVTASTPAKGWDDGAAVSAAALVTGLEAMVVVVLNHNVERTRVTSDTPSRFHPTSATVEVRVPPWLKPVDVFSVSYQGLTDLAPQPLSDNVLRLETTVEVNDLIVITGRAGMKAEIARKLARMQEFLEQARAARPTPTEEASPYKE